MIQALEIVNPAEEPDGSHRRLHVEGTEAWTFVRVSAGGRSATTDLSVEELDALIEALNVLREARTA